MILEEVSAWLASNIQESTWPSRSKRTAGENKLVDREIENAVPVKMPSTICDFPLRRIRYTHLRLLEDTRPVFLRTSSNHGRRIYLALLLPRPLEADGVWRLAEPRPRWDDPRVGPNLEFPSWTELPVWEAPREDASPRPLLPSPLRRCRHVGQRPSFRTRIGGGVMQV